MPGFPLTDQVLELEPQHQLVSEIDLHLEHPDSGLRIYLMRLLVAPNTTDRSFRFPEGVSYLNVIFSLLYAISNGWWLFAMLDLSNRRFSVLFNLDDAYYQVDRLENNITVQKYFMGLDVTSATSGDITMAYELRPDTSLTWDRSRVLLGERPVIDQPMDIVEQYLAREAVLEYIVANGQMQLIQL